MFRRSPKKTSRKKHQDLLLESSNTTSTNTSINTTLLLPSHSQSAFAPPPPPPLPPPRRYNASDHDDDEDNHSLKRFFQRSSFHKKDKRQVQYEQDVARILASVQGDSYEEDEEDGDERGGGYNYHRRDHALDQNSLLLKHEKPEEYENDNYNKEDDEDDDNSSFKRLFRSSPRRERKRMMNSNNNMGKKSQTTSSSPPLLSHNSSSGSFDDIFKDFNPNNSNSATTYHGGATSSKEPHRKNTRVKLYGMRQHDSNHSHPTTLTTSTSITDVPPPPLPPSKFSSVLKKYQNIKKKKKNETPQNYQRMTSPYSLESITGDEEEQEYHYDDKEDDHEDDRNMNLNPTEFIPNLSLEDEMFDGNDFPFSPKKIGDDFVEGEEVHKEGEGDDDDDVWTLSFPDDPFDGLQELEVELKKNPSSSPQPQAQPQHAHSHQPQLSQQRNRNDSDDIPLEEENEPGRIPISQINIETAPVGKSRIVSEMVKKYENYSKSLVTALEAEQSNTMTVQWSHDQQSIASSMGDSLNTFQDLPLMHMQDFLKLKETDRVQAYCDLFTMAGAMMRDVEEKREDIFVLARQVDELHKRVMDMEDSKSKMHEKNRTHREEVKMLQAEVESRNVVIENLKRAMDEWKSQEEDRANAIIQNSNLKPSSGKPDDSLADEIKTLKEEVKAHQKKIEEKDKEIRMKNRIIDEQTMQLKSSRLDAAENETTIREMKDSLGLKEFLLEDVKKQLESEKKKRKKLKRAYLKRQEAETSNLIVKSRTSDSGLEENPLGSDSNLDLDLLLSKSDEVDTSDHYTSGVIPSELVENAKESQESISSQVETDAPKQKSNKISEAIQRFTPKNVALQSVGANGSATSGTPATNTVKNPVLTQGGVPLGISYLQLHPNSTQETGIVRRNIAAYSGNTMFTKNDSSNAESCSATDFEDLSKQLHDRDIQIEKIKSSHKIEVSILIAQKNELEHRLSNIEALFEDATIKLQELQSRDRLIDQIDPGMLQIRPEDSKSYIEQHSQTDDVPQTDKLISADKIQDVESDSQDNHILSSSELQASSEPTEERKDQTNGDQSQQTSELQSASEASHEMEVMRRQQKMLMAKIKSLEEEIDTVSGLLEETILSMREKDGQEEGAIQEKSSKRLSDYSDEDVQQLERICKLHQLTIIRQRNQTRAILAELDKAKADVEKYQVESKAQEEKISILESQFSELNKCVDRGDISADYINLDDASGKKRSSIIQIDAGYLSSLEAKLGMSTELTNQIKELKTRNEMLQEKLNLQSDINQKLDDLTLKLQGRDMEIAVLKEKIGNTNSLIRNDSSRSFQSRGRSPAFGNRSAEPRRSPEFRRSPSFGSRVLSGNLSTGNSVISLDYSLSDDEGDKDEVISKLRLIISKRDEAVSFLKEKISNLEKVLPSAKGHTLDLRKISLLQEMLEASVRRLTLVVNRAEAGDDHQHEYYEGRNEDKVTRRFVISIGDKLSLLHDYQRVSLHLIESRLANELESLKSGKEIVGLDENVMTRFDRCLDSLRETEEELRGHLEKLNVELNQHQIQLEAKDDVISTLIRKDIEQKDSIDNMEMELKVFKGLSEYQSVNLGMMNRLKECSRLEQELEEKERVIHRLNNVIDEYRSYAGQNMTTL